MFEPFDSRNGGLAIEMWRAEDDVPTGDTELQDEIWARLRRVAAFEGDELKVVVHEGVATLSGMVPSHAEKMTAANLAASVPGIKQVDNAVFVVPAPADRRSDEALLHMVRSALEWDSQVPHTRVTATVLNGHVGLAGVVDHADERDAAEDAVARLVGVCGVTNRISVPVRPADPDALTVAGRSVADALGHEGTHARLAERDGTIELRGRVRSLAWSREAEHAVRRALGDMALENHLTIER